MDRRLAFAVLLPLVAACGIDKADIGVDTPPLLVRAEGTVPADSTAHAYDADGLDLVVGFNRAFEGGEVATLELVPRPAGAGAVENPGTNRRQLVWHDVVLDPAYPVYRLLLDGPSLPEPVLIRYYSAALPGLTAGIQGHVFISRGITRPENALVYALVPLGRDAEFDLSGAEDEIFGRPVLSVARTVIVPTEPGGWFALTGLESWKWYLVFAVLDTSRDGSYDLEEDWWGFYGDPTGLPVEVMAGVSLGPLLDPPLPPMRTDVDFNLFAPGTVDPWLDQP